MARTYKILAPATHVDGEPLDAWTARTRMQTNGEAVYEEARDDGRVILQQPLVLTSEYFTWFGPVPIRMCRDRDGVWRVQRVDILVSAGGYDKLVFRVALTDTWRLPRSYDPYAEWTVDAGLTLQWRGFQSITIPTDWEPSIIDRGPDGDRGRVRIGWFTLWIMDTPVGADPSFGGYRHYELVDDEP